MSQSHQNVPSPATAFRFSGKKLHLTYRGHLPLEELKLHLENKMGSFSMYSLVHENGAEKPPEVTQEDSQEQQASVPYAHTHVALVLQMKFETRKASAWDFQGVHPNLKQIRTQTHLQRIWTYHQKAPISRLVSERGPLTSTPGGIDALIAAPSLLAAVLLAGVEVRTVRDIQILRQDRMEETVIPALSEPCLWTIPFQRHPCVVLTGDTGTGKTRYALAHFENPLLVSHMDDLKQLKPSHDGIVFDDIGFSHWPLESCIHLCDVALPRTINVKHGSVTIPAGKPRFFTTNREFTGLFPNDEWGALKRRTHVLRVRAPLFTKVKAPATIAEPERIENDLDDQQQEHTDDWSDQMAAPPEEAARRPSPTPSTESADYGFLDDIDADAAFPSK